MTLRNGDYEIHGDSITIKKEVLQDWYNHYRKVANEKDNMPIKMYYNGKADDVLDLLKLFEELEP